MDLRDTICLPLPQDSSQDPTDPTTVEEEEVEEDTGEEEEEVVKSTSGRNS